MEEDVSPRRIHIIGGPGSGKSTLASNISSALGLPIYDLDSIAFDGPEFRQRPLSERLAAVKRIASERQWITEGMFVGWIDDLLDAADVIIWLDHIPWHRAFARILRRFLEGGITEARRQPGTRKFTRFDDYIRHVRQLAGVFVTSRSYYQAPTNTSLDECRQASRYVTAQSLSRYAEKVIHCVRPQDIPTIITRINRPSYQDIPANGPVISIIINNHNYGQFLASAIDSAINQQYPRTEVIVVDDGSTDNSREVISRYHDRVVAVLKENGGQASAFNSGFRVSNGDAVIFLDADDILLPYTATSIASAFSLNPKVAKVQYRMEIIDDSGMPTGEVLPGYHLRLLSGDLRRVVINFPEDMTWMGTSGNAFGRSVLLKILPMSESAYGAGGADWYLSHVSPLLGDVASLDLIGAYYRVHGANLYHRSQLNLDQIRQTINYMSTTRHFLAVLLRQQGNLANGTGTDDWPKESVSFVAHRIISLKLDPAHHPITTDSVVLLVGHGITAACRRFDARLPMKVLYILWFALMAVSPRSFAEVLGNVWLFPDRRRPVNRLLGAFHRVW